jgi:hypothetical protein
MNNRKRPAKKCFGAGSRQFLYFHLLNKKSKEQSILKVWPRVQQMQQILIINNLRITTGG